MLFTIELPMQVSKKDSRPLLHLVHPLSLANARMNLVRLWAQSGALPGASPSQCWSQTFNPSPLFARLWNGTASGFGQSRERDFGRHTTRNEEARCNQARSPNPLTAVNPYFLAVHHLYIELID